MKKKEYSLDMDKDPIRVEFTDLAEQANGSVTISRGDTKVFVTATMSSHESDRSYFPLTVDYEEKFYAAGQILGSRFVRREGRPSDEAVLSGRVIDRTIRPLFDHRFRREVQVVATILSMGEYDPDMLGVIGASLAIATSDIPWGGPISAIRVGKKSGSEEFETSPTYEYRNAEDMHLDVVLCGDGTKINMIEVEGDEVGEGVLSKALEAGLEKLDKIQNFQKEILKEKSKEKVKFEPQEPSEKLQELFDEKIKDKISPEIFQSSKEAIKELNDEWEEIVEEWLPDEMHLASGMIDNFLDKMVHDEALIRDTRVDGRGFNEIRDLYAQAGGVSERLHGSGIFYRGATHIFSALTLGGPSDSLVIDGMEIQAKKRYIHHYNFPPFSVGETGRIGGFNRRMIGHGALAEKALKPVIPDKESFPYTIRIVSEAFSSNGSTSMASVCGSTLALMDAGIPIKEPVAGIAMGVMVDEKNGENYKILTDIQGPEDHHGDMDLKVAGTKNGVTAVQMDVKVSGVNLEILKKAFVQAKDARFEILEVMEAEIEKPRESLNPNAPHIETLKIKEDQIGLVIGPGGKMINEIKDLTATEIDIEDDGSVFITGSQEGTSKAKGMIADLTHEHEAGEKYEGEVTRIEDFGAFVRITPYSEGLVHISEMAPFHVSSVKDYLSIGDKVPVIIKEIDDKNRINLSIKQVAPEHFNDKSSEKRTGASK